MSTHLFSVVFDCTDHIAQVRWWADVLAVPVAGEREDEAWITPPDSPELNFVPVREPKTSKNRIHFDLRSDSKRDRDEIVERLTRNGATHVDIGQPEDAWWTVLADPEGNEFCVVNPVPPAVSPAQTGPISGIAYDAKVPAVLGRFWSAATGWPIVHEDATTPVLVLRSPDNVGPFLGFHAGPDKTAAKPVKNRLHLDVAPFTDDDTAAEVERLGALGARRIDIGQGDVPWVVMADPEDNEFCVLTPR
jgi:hypothetical protein